MKPQRNNPFALFLSVLAFTLTACSGAAFQDSNATFKTTYPSQFLVGDVYILENQEIIDGNVAGIGTTLIIEEGATVHGNISLVGSNLEIAGRVDGDINAFAGHSYIQESAEITGSFNQIIHQLDIHPNALIQDEINSYEFPTPANVNVGESLTNIMGWLRPSTFFVFQTVRIVAYTLIALLVISLFQVPTIRAVTCMKSNLIAAWGAGIITMIAVPIISLIFLITICLSPLAIILLLAFLLSLLWGWVLIASAIGQLLTRWLQLEWRVEASTVLGAVMVGLLTSIATIIPSIGFLINIMIAATGLGGVLLSRFGTIAEE